MRSNAAAVLIGCGVALGIMTLLAAFAMVASVAAPSSTPKAPEPEHSALEARTMCKQFVRDALKSPATAEFGGYGDAKTRHASDGEYVVQSHVESQNGFGALVRSEYQCRVRYAGDDRWRLVGLDIR